MIKKEIIWLIFFLKKFESRRNVFLVEKFLALHKLHVYGILKFVLQSVSGLHSKRFLNELFQFDAPSYTILEEQF